MGAIPAGVAHSTVPAAQQQPSASLTPAHPTVPPRATPAPTPVAPTRRPGLQDILASLQSSGRLAVPSAPQGFESDEEEWRRIGKRQKVNLNPQGFTFGPAANIEQVLRHYPGKGAASPSLACKELLGPVILVQMIKAGSNIPTFLQEFKHWKKTANGMPSQAEMEAHSLGRMIHMEMLKHESPREALENRPSLEISLRRLFAVLYVEEAMNRGKFRQRASAWQFVHFLHESVPSGTVMCDHIDDAMTQRMTLEKKRLVAIKALEESRATIGNSPPSQRNQQPRNNGVQQQRHNPARRHGRL